MGKGRRAIPPPIGWMTRAQAARYLGVSEWIFLSTAQRNDIKAIKHQGKFIYKTEDVERMSSLLYPL